MSNRCGHDPDNPRHCDIIRRGKRGQPPLLGRLSARLSWSLGNESLLKKLHQLNPSGRKKRTERLEVCVSVAQYLVAHWMDLATRRCARPGAKHGQQVQDFLEAPTAAHLAASISKKGAWRGTGRLTTERVYLALQDLQQAGYISRTKQARTKMASGSWCSHPKIISFTRSFFEDLGGRKLWREIRAKGKERWQKMQTRWEQVLEGVDYFSVKKEIAEYLKPGLILSPGQAYQYRKQSPPKNPKLFSQIRFTRAR